MNKYDVVEKIPPQRLLRAFFSSPSELAEPEKVLRAAGIIHGNWQAHYFNWGRNALHALFKQLPYKTVHFPAFTCPVLTDAALAAGKKVKLLEVDPGTSNLDLKKLPRTHIECLVVVHTFGNPVDISEIRKRLPGTFIVEDCAHALFSKIKGDYVGSQGNSILFSLYKQTPNLNGALLLTKREFQFPLREEGIAAFWPRLIFKTSGWHHLLVSQLRRGYINTLEDREFNDNIAARQLVKNLFSLGFKKLVETIDKRRQIWRWYAEVLKDSRYFDCQQINQGGEISAYQFVIHLKPKFIKFRDQLVWQMRRQEIFLDRLWYSAPITQRRFLNYQQQCPEALKLAKAVISLPVNPALDKAAVEYLVSQPTSFLVKKV